MIFHKIIATTFGIGYIGKGAGTYASIFTCLLWYFLQPSGYELKLAPVLVALLLTIQGVRSANEVEALWGKDHQRVVIDEVAGMCITLLFVPLEIKYIIAGLVLFRFFDILKPLGIRRLEKWPGGWGVMADDVLAGIYANIVMQIIIFFNIF
ncbi:phosphatidylglycerophosphatase A [Pedobacter sp. SL55]|uniref:phosphatidylglycerophosphatase A family protein n=1 Tax=Pedobacter sp. SL55 TaxID=2995161 RepID=UPI00226D8AEF|nr:phosphatidylglycerophosphatase A [Pedobacter sp. SL55]WAC42394.1 phosphatidylglycerophosphatase A [Pedobacter sp. SL55]